MLELAVDRPMAAATKAADKATVRNRAPRLAVNAEGSEARWYEPVVFFMFHLRSTGMNDAEATTFLYYNFKACAIQPWREPAQRWFKEWVSVSASWYRLRNGTTDATNRALRRWRAMPAARSQHHSRAPQCERRRNLRENIFSRSPERCVAPRCVDVRFFLIAGLISLQSVSLLCAATKV